MNNIHQILDGLVKGLSERRISEASVLDWAGPIFSFGDVLKSKVATLGLNPSNLEFLDRNGNELDGSQRRFHTLKSLGINGWQEAQTKHLDLIIERNIRYFEGNPYDSWFKKLDFLISASHLSYYFPLGNACHLDLVPYATALKWSEIKNSERKKLIEFSSNSLGHLLKNSSVDTLVLNGKTVVNSLQLVSQVNFDVEIVPEWTLPRSSSGGIVGYSYKGIVREIGGVRLNRKLKVLGYNHNIQSSFGVTTEVQTSIRNWIKANL